MNKKEFYITDASVSDKESFNNTILLLTMVKSEYYYIIGFSRLKGIIEIGFDFESELHGKITESVTVNFNYGDDYITIESTLKNISNTEFADIQKLNNSKFHSDESGAFYRLAISKDKVIPTGINKMNAYILNVKTEISDFLENHYKFCVNKRQG